MASPSGGSRRSHGGRSSSKKSKSASSGKKSSSHRSGHGGSSSRKSSNRGQLNLGFSDQLEKYRKNNQSENGSEDDTADGSCRIQAPKIKVTTMNDYGDNQARNPRSNALLNVSTSHVRSGSSSKRSQPSLSPLRVTQKYERKSLNCTTTSSNGSGSRPSLQGTVLKHN